ncbi:unnamed protein product [Effrenium voratum]|uniref:Uncharacterized protein n=1 Tax=Effrenium voratum TaxID=2562239 RepID=A0AA36N7A2_9DINO|nr:unnamed protein product [Effrenium voratum]CAJ1444017.1 unnamed protein product [Effrenium voratum]
MAVHHVGVSERGTILVALAPSKAAPAAAPGFGAFARSADLAAFVRRVLEVVEQELGLSSYHLRVLPYQRAFSSDEALALFLLADDAAPVREASAAWGFLFYVAGTNDVVRYVPVMSNMDDLDAPIIYQDAEGKTVEVPGLTLRSVVLRGQEPEAAVRCSLDFQGRSCYVVVMAPGSPAALKAAAAGAGEVVRLQRELEDPELQALWGAAAELAESHGGFEEMHLNAGNFQNVAQMHLKVWICLDQFLEMWGDQPVYQQLRASRHQREKAHAAAKKAAAEAKEARELEEAIALSLQ